MSTSPTKRRKSNSSSAIPVNTPNTNNVPDLQPARQRPLNRASFLSPTKASLARSHPDLLSRASNRSTVTKAQRGADHGPVKPSQSASLGSPLARLEARTLQTTPLPHRTRPVRDSPAPDGTAPPDTHILGANAEIELAERDGADSPLDSLVDGSAEPELPPTPTELGLEKAPVRPKGLLSSSPSWRHKMRKIKRRQMREGLGSSPLKSKNTYFTKGADRDNNDFAANYRHSGAKVSSEVRAKQKLLDELTSQLDQLKGDISDLEYEMRRSERPRDHPAPNDDYLQKLMSLLTTANPSCAPSQPQPLAPPPMSSILSFLLPFSAPRYTPKPVLEPSVSPIPENPFALDELSDPLPYLTLFAPLDLVAHTTTTASSSNAGNTISTTLSFIQRHDFTLSAPSEFPPLTYRVPVVVYTDPGNRSVISISVSVDAPTNDSSRERGIPLVQAPLKMWIDARLSDSLLKLDVSGLCWGICRYWEAIVSRAKVWMQLETLLSDMRKGTRSRQPSISLQSATVYEETPRKLVPHLDRNSFLFSFPDEPHQPQLLVTCSLTLDIWTSEPELHPNISVISPRGAGGKVEGEAKTVFGGVLKRHGDIDSADLTSAVKAVLATVLM